MELRFNSLNALSASTVRPIAPASPAPVGGAGGGGGAVQGVPQGGGFGDAFRTALQNVSTAQNRASHLQTEFQMGNPNVSLEQTMLAMQKAQIGFQATLHVRNRMMQAYTDVMNMQV